MRTLLYNRFPCIGHHRNGTDSGHATSCSRRRRPNSKPRRSAQAQPEDQNRDRSVLNVKPGAEAIKPKDYYERSGTLHPFRRMPKFILVDQYKIWTSPFHTSKRDAKCWAI